MRLRLIRASQRTALTKRRGEERWRETDRAGEGKKKERDKGGKKKTRTERDDIDDDEVEEGVDGDGRPLTGRARGRWIYKWRQKKRGTRNIEYSGAVEEKPCIISFSFSAPLIYFVWSTLNGFLLLNSGFARSSISRLQLRRQSHDKQKMSSKWQKKLQPASDASVGLVTYTSERWQSMKIGKKTSVFAYFFLFTSVSFMSVLV